MLATSTYLIVFRIVHIMAGVAWAGSVFLFVVFVQPTSAAIGPAAGPFMQELLGRRKVVNGMLWLAAFTIGGGVFLYWHDWQAFGGSETGSAHGSAWCSRSEPSHRSWPSWWGCSGPGRGSIG
jgi:hypothetical protein